MALTKPFQPADQRRGQILQPGHRALVRMLFACALVLLSEPIVSAQDLQQFQQPNQPVTPSQLAVVHGLVRNGASGEPLPRALVRINGDASTGVLTDGQGRFEINDVPEGPQEFTVIKPGFIDRAESGDNAANSHGFGHNIIVVAQMGAVAFTMMPVNSIHGQIQLSTGDLAQGINVTLWRRSVQDGRAVWQNEANARTNSEGVYRFGQLADGFYAVYTEPTMDSEAANNLVATGSGKNVAREGYASVFYPDARDLASAAKIHVSGGEQAQANISLTLEPFQPVTATVMMPRTGPGAGENVAIQVTDAQAHPLPYTAQYDAATHTAQAALPDGAYNFIATETMNPVHVMMTDGPTAPGRALRSDSQPATGEVSFSVAGHPVSNLRIPLSPQAGNPVQVTIEHGASGSPSSRDPRIFVTVSQTGGGLGDGIVGSYAEGASTGPLRAQHPPPGSYWVHTSIAPRELCEASFTAGGASLAHEPLVLGAAGSTAPLVLTLRDDCARLTVSLPDSVGLSAGEEPYFTVYVVPDFDSTEDVIPQTLRPSTGGRITLTGLTPGNYHVFTFNHPVALEYRNPAVLAALQGQPIALSPGAEAELTLEAPPR